MLRFLKFLWRSVDGKQLLMRVKWNLPAFLTSSGVVWPHSCLLMRKWKPALMIAYRKMRTWANRLGIITSPRQSINHKSFWPRRLTIEEGWYLFSSPEPRVYWLEENELVSRMPFILRLHLSLGKCLATKHDQTLFGDQICWYCTVAEWHQTCLNESNVLHCLKRWLTSFKVYQTRSNKVSKREMFDHRTSGSCLMIKHFPFGHGFKVQQKQHFADCWALCAHSGDGIVLDFVLCCNVVWPRHVALAMLGLKTDHTALYEHQSLHSRVDHNRVCAIQIHWHVVIITL